MDMAFIVFAYKSVPRIYETSLKTSFLLFLLINSRQYIEYMQLERAPTPCHILAIQVFLQVLGQEGGS